MRLDRVFECEVVPNSKFFEVFKQPAVTYTIAAKYKLFGDRQVYRAEYRFDKLKCTEQQHRSGSAPKRETWIHKDQQQREIYSQPIQPISEGDSIEFSITIANLSGFVEWLEWEPCHLAEAPNISSLTYDKDLIKSLFFRHSSQKIFCDLNRICELEDATVEWYEERYYQRQELFDLSFMQGQDADRDYSRKNPVFIFKDLKYTGVDGSICKAVMEANRPGLISPRFLYGISVRVLPAYAELTNEVKRIGYIRDRECEMQLRVGDTLILYISTTIA